MTRHIVFFVILPQSKTFEEIVTVLESHYEPKPIVIAQRFHFHRRNQLPTENIVQYMAELRRLSTHSSFGPYLNEALRNRLVFGLCSDTETAIICEGFDFKSSIRHCSKYGSCRQHCQCSSRLGRSGKHSSQE